MLLQTHDVGWRLGETPILQRVHLSVAPGELVALMGRNGAGKSSLLDLIAGLRRPTDGAISFDDRPLEYWSADDLARSISHLPQMVRSDVGISVEELVLMGRYPHAVGWSESDADRAAAVRAMTRCGCLEFRDRRLSTLSGGERQRVLLAACLAQEPRLLLLDEPATFLDIEQQLQCFSMLREEAAQGVACIAVTHDLNLALTFCTRLVVLAGKTVAVDIPVERAADDTAWLSFFSARLVVSRTPSGHPWVSYA
jgi:iron complex transport system ATP-binding protein